MTQTFAVNSNNDLYIGKDGNLAIVTGLEAVLQNCAHVAQAILGSCVLQTNYGVPYFQLVFNGVPKIQQFQAALRQAFLGVDGVIDVISLTTTNEKDILTYQAVISTIYGNASLNGTGVNNNG